MNDNNNNNNSKPESDEPQIVRTFADIFRSRFESVSNSGRLSQIYGDSKDYVAEQKTIRDINAPGVIWGIGAGIAGFVFLRKAPLMLQRYMMRRKFGSGGSGYKFDDVAAQQNNPFQTADQGMVRPRGPVIRTLGFVFDVLLSTWTATVVSMYATNGEKMREGLSSIPLVEGRSVLAEEICDDFIKQYQSLSKEFWKKDHSNHPSLNYIEMFVKNCQKRRKYERQLREERGLQKTDPVLIPSPGVPVDLDVEEEEEYVMTEDKEEVKGDYFEDEKEDVKLDDGYMEGWSSIDDFENDKKEGSGKSPKPRWGI